MLTGCRDNQADSESSSHPDVAEQLPVNPDLNKQKPQNPKLSKTDNPNELDNMHTEAWQQIKASLKTTLSKLEEKDAEVSDLEFFDPPSRQQVDELEREMGIKLPESFRQFLAISGGFRFDWTVESSPFSYVEYGGNSEVDFLRASEELSLAEVYRQFQADYQDYGVDDEAQVGIIRRCFPLYLADLAGNALVIRLDSDPPQIHLLKSELAWHISDDLSDDSRSLVGQGLPEFLLQWAALGGPSTENLSDFVEACGGQTLDADSAAGKAVQKWLSTSE